MVDTDKNESFPLPSKTLHLPMELRAELKKPLGELFTTKPTETLLSRIEAEQPPFVLFVGDYCVLDSLKHGYIPPFSIIDGTTKRQPFQKITVPNAKVIKSTNPPATITVESWKLIRSTIQDVLLGSSSHKNIADGKQKVSSHDNLQPVVLLIAGEEDLLVIPAVLEAPLGSFIVYGQPNEGIVLVKVTLNVRFKCKKLIEQMKVERQ